MVFVYNRNTAVRIQFCYVIAKDENMVVFCTRTSFCGSFFFFASMGAMKITV